MSSGPQPRSFVPGRGTVAWTLIVAAAACALLPMPARTVERAYSRGLYLWLQPHVTRLSNLTSVSLLDVLLAGLLVAAGLSLARGCRGPWTRRLAVVGLRAATWAAAVYLLFLVCWGLNYRRVHLIERLDFDPSQVTSQAARALAVRATDELGRLHAAAHRVGWAESGDRSPTLTASFDRTLRRLGVGRAVVPGRPKRTVLDWYFRRAGVDGMTDPFLLETLIVSDLLPFERPLVVAHEWSHLAGFADEGDANFAGWLACMGGSVADQYSGWLFLYGQVSGDLPAAERASVAGMLAPGPRADLTAMTARAQRNLDPRLAAAGWRVYDRFLKANRIQAGAASYGEVVRLVLGARLGEGPVLDQR